jgi:hypothetical protein
MRVWQLKPDSLMVLCHLRYRFTRLKRDRNTRPRKRIKRIASGSFASGHAHYRFSACSRRDSSLKGCYEIIGGAHLKMKKQIPSIDMVRSAWRRVKKDIKDAIIRDLQPVRDVKGGGGTRRGESKSTTGEGTRDTRGGH